MGYFKQTLHGVSWMGALRWGTRAMAFAKIAVLARLLSPVQFGVYGIANIVLGFLEILVETGVNVFLLQEKEDIDKYINTAWAISILRGLIIFIIIVALARPISVFFNSPGSLNLIYLISLVPLVRGFINPSIIKFLKQLDFRKEFFFRSSIFAVDAVATVLVTLMTRSAVGLVWGLLTGAIYEVVISFVFVRPRPKLALDFGQARQIISRGIWVTGFGLFDYIYTQLDNVVVGKLLGEAPLGFYQNAYKIAIVPLTEFGDVLFRASAPLFITLTENRKMLKDSFLKNLAVTVAVVIPLGFIIYLFSPQVVFILLGKGWEPVVPVLRILAFLGTFRAISSSGNALFVAVQKQKYVAISNFVSALVLAATIVPLIKAFGLPGAGISALAGTLVAIPLNAYFVSRVFRNL